MNQFLKMQSNNGQNDISKKMVINFKSYLLVVFFIAPYIISFISSFGLPPFFGFLFLISCLYIPLFYGILCRKISINLINLLLFLFLFLYVIYCKNNLSFQYNVYSSETNGINSRILTGCSSIFALIFLGMNFSNSELTMGIKASGYLTLIISAVRFFVITINGTEFLVNGYDMNFGYTLLFPALIFLSFYFLENRKIYLIITFISFLFILFFGSRGPVLCFIVCFFLEYLLLFFSKKTISRKIVTLFLFAFLFLFVLFIYFLIPRLFNVSSMPRTLQYLFNLRDINASDQGRIILANDVSNLIKNQPFWGYGMLSDQGFLGIGKYSHNIFLEFIITFGKLFGILFLFLIAILVVKVFKSKKIVKENKVFFSIFVSSSLCRLMISNSFWYETMFWCMLGLGLLFLSKPHKMMQR